MIMGKIKETMIDAGDEVVRATGELDATVKEAVKAVSKTEVDQEEVGGWLTTLIKAVIAVFK